jgi:hypothetical protein
VSEVEETRLTWRKLAWMADEVRFQQWAVAAATMTKIHNAAAAKKEHLVRDWAEFHPLMVRGAGGGAGGAQQVTGSFNRAMCDALEAIEKQEQQGKA